MKIRLNINILFWLLVITSCTNASSQSYYNQYAKIAKKKNVENLTFKVDSLLKFSKENNDLFSYREIAHKHGIYFYLLRNYTKAIDYTLLEVEDFEKHSVISEKYTKALYNLGTFYYYNLRYRESVKYFEKVIEIGFNNARTGQAYAEIGRNFGKMGDYAKAESFYEKGIKILKEKKIYRSLINQCVNYAILLKEVNTKSSVSRALRVLDLAMSLANEVEITNRNKSGLLGVIASLHVIEKNYNFNKAHKYYKEKLNLAKSTRDSIRIVESYNNLSHLYNIGKRDSVKYYINKGFDYAIYDEAKARLHDNLCDYYVLRKEFDKALESIHNSLEIHLSVKIKDIPSISELRNSTLKEYTLYCLKKKAEILIKLNRYQEAIENINSADWLVNFMQSGFNEEATKLVWRRETSQAYLQGTYAAHLLKDSEAAFSFMEKNKALLLSESILKNTEFENLPKNVSDTEIEFKKSIYELENQLSKNESNAVLQDSLFNAKRRHEDYVDSLKTAYPKYFDRKINVEQISLSEVQEGLEENEAVISYIWNKFDEEKEILLGLAVTGSTAKTFEVPNTDSLRTKILHYQKFVSKPFSTKEEKDAYQKLAFELYQELFPTQEIRNLLKEKNLTVIPDGELQNFPFEALITKNNSSQYLMLDSNTSYAYSYSFLKHNEQVKRKTDQSFIGYSPVDFTSLPSLKNSKREIEEANNQFGGITKLQRTATKEDFLTHSSQSKIIHLATHADAGENPWVAFADGKMELHELYTYKNNADLVTLSACNTSLGEVAKGEGVLSLARGFFYSGSKSVVSSLWEVNDSATSEIMIDFYKNIKEGQSKSDALNNAKRSYLNSHELSEQSPYYWSSFVLIGDPGVIDLSNNNYLYLVIGLVLIMGIIFFRKKRIF